MIDALLHAVRDAVRGGNYGYAGDGFCEIMPDGRPPPRAGNVFIAIHEGQSRSRADNCLDEYFAFVATLTMRVTVPLDRVGIALEAMKLVKVTGFNRRAEQLRAFLHMNWAVLGLANDNLVNMTDAVSVYGFCEPARYTGMSKPRLVGGEWFGASPEVEQVGLVADLTFDRCRRLQPIGMYV